MASKKIRDIAVKTGEYQDAQGQTKCCESSMMGVLWDHRREKRNHARTKQPVFSLGSGLAR